MPWDNEIWAPCRLGEKFEYTDLGNRRNGWLLSVSADWMGGRGNHCAVNRQEDLLMPHGGYNIKIGLGPRPWSKCWTFEPKIMIVPPYWIWDFSGFDADKLGIDLHKRDGAPRKIRLCALPGFVDSKNEEKTERNAGYLVVSHSGGGMLRQGTRKGIRRTPANRGMRAHWVVKGLDISEDVCHGMCP